MNTVYGVRLISDY